MESSRKQRLSKRNLRSFTLLETIAVLGIALIFVGFTSIELQHVQETLERRQVINGFKAGYEKIKAIGITKNQKTIVKNKENEHEIVFGYPTKVIYKIKYPSKMKVWIDHYELNVTEQGFSAPTTVIFREGNWKKELRLQMMWGEIIEV